jgi:hypothetical protein
MSDIYSDYILTMLANDKISEAHHEVEQDALARSVRPAGRTSAMVMRLVAAGATATLSVMFYLISTK